MIDLTPLLPQLKGKPVAIFGLGKSGMSVFSACEAAGIKTVLWDDNPELIAKAEALGAKTEDLTTASFNRFSLLCLAPGVPLTQPAPHLVVVQALQGACDIVGDIELFHCAQPQARSIGITGTNGKSTTTALTGHILKTAGINCAVGGNIGEPVLSLPRLDEDGIYVLELSSYQLDLCHAYAPTISVLINISPDHLDRHGGIAGYAEAKARIFRNSGEAVIGIDDEWSAKIAERVQKDGLRRVTPVSTTQPLLHGISISQEGLLLEHGRICTDLRTCPTLAGQHNWQNAGIAWGLARAAGVDPDAIIQGLQSFPGLAHRQHIVATINGVRYVNDSKATNDQAAAVALATFDPIYWIAGGKSKGGGYAECEKHLSHVQHTFLIGEAEEEMATWLMHAQKPFTKCENLDIAYRAAHKMAQFDKIPGATVLLAPACASFDQFSGFEARGDAFASLVKRSVP